MRLKEWAWYKNPHSKTAHNRFRVAGLGSAVARLALPITILTAVITIVLPFVGGSGPSLTGTTALSEPTDRPIFATPVVVAETVAAVATAKAGDYLRADRRKRPAAPIRTDSEHLAQKPVPKPPAVAPPGSGGAVGPRGTVASRSGGTGGSAVHSCPAAVGGTAGGAPDRSSAGGVAGTTSGDLAAFAAAYNAIRVANCLQPVPTGHIRYDSCMEARLFWMAEDPSTDTASAWGHLGSARSDGVPSQGCDGNLAGGSSNTGETVAQKWWASSSHRASLYRPSFTGNTAGVCVQFAMTHGGLPNESADFTRAAARWVGC